MPTLVRRMSGDMLERRTTAFPSAFAHLFRDVTGRSPYQLLKKRCA